MILAAHADRGVLREERPRLLDPRLADVDLSREHERLRARPRRREPAGDEELIGADLHVDLRHQTIVTALPPSHC